MTTDKPLSEEAFGQLEYDWVSSGSMSDVQVDALLSHARLQSAQVKALEAQVQSATDAAQPLWSGRVKALEAELEGLRKALALADKVVDRLVQSRRSYGYVIASVLPVDQELEACLQARAALSRNGGAT